MEDWIDGVVPEKVREIRRKANNYVTPTQIECGDGLIADMYMTAKEYPTAGLKELARKIGIETNDVRYLKQQNEDFLIAMRVGQLDGKKDLTRKLVHSMVQLANGFEYEEVTTTEVTHFDKQGNPVGKPSIKTKTAKKYYPPNLQAALELLRKIDPSWNPKATIEHTTNNHDFAEDQVVNIDTKMLSPMLLRELLKAAKSDRGDKGDTREFRQKQSELRRNSLANECVDITNEIEQK